VNGLREEWDDSVAIVQINIHRRANRDLVDRLGVRFTPTFVLFDDGREVWRATGVPDAAAVRAQVEALG
jgi:thioredoxin-like negative regulator of GroEL